VTGIIPAPIASLPWRVIFILCGLVGFGATVLFSAAGGSFDPWAGKHILRFSIFMAMAIIMSRLPLTFWRSITFPVYVILFALLLVVELVGFVGGGSQRWINLGFMSLQPSEMMKPAVVLAIAWYYDQLPPAQIGNFRALWPPALMMGLPWFFVAIQPDLGTSIAVLFGGLVVVFVAGLPMRWFLSAGGAMLVIAPLAFMFGLRQYQRDRVLVFLNPEADPLGTGYHINQSAIAIGSGGFFGKGFLNGTQSHLDYLPEGHTDFVFATMAEEWGMVGGLFVLFLFYLLIRWGLTVGMKSRSRYGKLVAIGLTATIFFYIMINLMMVMGLAPVVGIPLPFISHGGSSMLTIMICIGIIMSIERHPERKTFS
jgi:rod shape determining protein RodA